MKTLFSVLVAVLLFSSTARAEKPLPEFCAATRAPRVQASQLAAKVWLARVASLKSACKASWVKTGAITLSSGRASPELRGDVACLKGPPPGETLESAWAVLSLFLAEPVATDEVLTTGVDFLDGSDARCQAFDAAQGLSLTPIVNDMPAIRRLLSWKPTP